MDLAGNHLLITGGAGFIGSHLAERLITDNDILIVDDCSHGEQAWVPEAARFIQADLTEQSVVADVVSTDIDAVIHLAAGKDVNDPDPRGQFEANTRMTYNLLEEMNRVGISNFVYTSSSTVYGEAPRPTPEDYAPEPISAYGAAKTAEESLCSVYAHSHEITTWIFRFANIVGPRLQPGAVIVDFIEKLQATPTRLEILGDGRQEKSYLHITDCLEAICHVVEHADAAYNVYNLGTASTTSVTTIADIVAEELGLSPEYEYTGGDRGWTGDVPRMRLAIDKLRELGWAPEYSSDEAVRHATRELIAERTT